MPEPSNGSALIRAHQRSVDAVGGGGKAHSFFSVACIILKINCVEAAFETFAFKNYFISISFHIYFILYPFHFISISRAINIYHMPPATPQSHSLPHRDQHWFPHKPVVGQLQGHLDEGVRTHVLRLRKVLAVGVVTQNVEIQVVDAPVEMWCGGVVWGCGVEVWCGGVVWRCSRSEGWCGGVVWGCGVGVQQKCGVVWCSGGVVVQRRCNVMMQKRYGEKERFEGKRSRQKYDLAGSPRRSYSVFTSTFET